MIDSCGLSYIRKKSPVVSNSEAICKQISLSNRAHSAALETIKEPKLKTISIDL